MLRAVAFVTIFATVPVVVQDSLGARGIPAHTLGGVAVFASVQLEVAQGFTSDELHREAGFRQNAISAGPLRDWATPECQQHSR
jgi:enoyl-[acyl-carrier-protein] reductase (NADH)